MHDFQKQQKTLCNAYVFWGVMTDDGWFSKFNVTDCEHASMHKVETLFFMGASALIIGQEMTSYQAQQNVFLTYILPVTIPSSSNCQNVTRQGLLFMSSVVHIFSANIRSMPFFLCLWCNNVLGKDKAHVNTILILAPKVMWVYYRYLLGI